LVVTSALLLPSSAEAQQVRPDFFGMHDAAVASGALPGVSVGAVRLWDTGTSWRDIERVNGTFDFAKLDTAVASARSAGLRPLIVLGQTPQFHATKPMAPGAFGPGATSMPTTTAWKRYVDAVARRYKTTVDYQVWNEPNVVNYWTGSVAQMASLTVTAAQEIRKNAGRKATVVAPSFPLRLAQQQRWFRSYWASKVGRTTVASQVNVVSLNLYPQANQAPEASMNLLKVAQRALPRAARRKPIWNTEINYGLLGGATARPVSDDKQAAYVARTLVLNANSGIQRVYWYAWNIGSIANTHLVGSDATTLTRAGRAWNVVRGWLVGTSTTGCEKVSKGKLKGLYTCTARKGRREVRRIYWKPTGKAATVTTDRTTSRWTDIDGHATRRRGAVRLKVGQLPIMVTSRH
jgi:hypothetical protein